MITQIYFHQCQIHFHRNQWKKRPNKQYGFYREIGSCGSGLWWKALFYNHCSQELLLKWEKQKAWKVSEAFPGHFVQCHRGKTVPCVLCFLHIPQESQRHHMLNRWLPLCWPFRKETCFISQAEWLVRGVPKCQAQLSQKTRLETQWCGPGTGRKAEVDNNYNTQNIQCSAKQSVGKTKQIHPLSK